MPFTLLQVSPRRYFVITKSTGRRHSLKPLPKSVAEAQLRALYAAENAKLNPSRLIR